MGVQWDDGPRRAWQQTADQCGDQHHDPDPLAPARGVLLGFAAATPFWVGLWLILR